MSGILRAEACGSVSSDLDLWVHECIVIRGCLVLRGGKGFPPSPDSANQTKRPIWSAVDNSLTGRAAITPFWPISAEICESTLNLLFERKATKNQRQAMTRALQSCPMLQSCSIPLMVNLEKASCPLTKL